MLKNSILQAQVQVLVTYGLESKDKGPEDNETETREPSKIDISPSNPHDLNDKQSAENVLC